MSSASAARAATTGVSSAGVAQIKIDAVDVVGARGRAGGRRPEADLGAEVLQDPADRISWLDGLAGQFGNRDRAAGEGGRGQERCGVGQVGLDRDVNTARIVPGETTQRCVVASSMSTPRARNIATVICDVGE